MTNKTKTVMVIAGGEWQVPLIQKAKQLGFYVVNTNLYENSLGFHYADVGVVADVCDREKTLEIAKKYKPDAVVTDQSDIAVPTVAYICDKLGLPGIGINKAELFTNKFCMREFCKKSGIPYPEYHLCKDINDINEFINNHKLPIIIKPINSQSSRGVSIVRKKSEVLSALNSAFIYSTEYVLAEEYMNGIEFTVEGIKLPHQKHISLATSIKRHLPYNEVVASSLLYKNNDSQFDLNELKKQNDEIVNMMELPFGLTHAEYIFWKNRFVLVEIAARGGGTKISSHIVPRISGIDTNKLLIESALGLSNIMNFPQPNDKNNIILLNFLTFPYGIVKNINGLEALNKDKRIIDINLGFRVGDSLKLPTDDRSRHGYIIIEDKSVDGIIQLSKEIADKVVVEVV